MKGDFTRLTFKQEKHYSSVRMQQGRVQVDADWNEQADITLRRIETEAADLIGGCGGPLHYPGFHLVANVNALNPEEQKLEGNKDGPKLGKGDLYVSAGRYYVDGVVAENERIVALSKQPNLPDLEVKEGVLRFGSLLKKAIGNGKIDFDLPEAGKDGVFQAYLDVWSRHLTALEDPSIREKALGGPDTATRTQTVWQVKLLKATDTKTTCLSPLNLPKSTGQLKAQTKEVATPPDPCVVPESAGYRGLENQFYRVEIHQGGAVGTATFKWSRENGSVVTRWTGQDTLKPNVLTVESPGRDAVLGFSTGDWVELTDDLRELWGLPGTMVQVETVEGQTITVKDGSKTGTLSFADFQGTSKIRRWDHHKDSQPTPGEAVLPVEEGKWIDLEQGVQVRFEAGGFYRTGDYWLIPGRTANADTQSGQIEWPYTEPQPPHGIQHHYCPLAVLTWNGTAFTSTDCRCVFSPMTHLTGFFYVGGDGQEAMPGDPVPQLLQVGVFNVGVSNICTPITGAKVRFTAQPANGRVAATHANLPSAGNSIDVVTGPDGIASCAWQLAADRNDPATWTPTTQQVEARLLDAIDTALPQVVRFTGNLSIASQVAYDPGDCITLQGQETVQKAIDWLSQLVSLYYVSGDGQEVMPGETLQPLKVLAANRCGPVQDVTVRFEVKSGSGTVNGASPSVDVPIIDGSGIATCNWTLDPTTPTQQVEATIVPDAAHPTTLPTSVLFTANLSIASQVAYNPSKCPNLAAAEVRTVQEAIDQLCQTGGRERGIHIKEVRLAIHQPLRNDTDVPVTALVQGVHVVCDGNVDQDSVMGKPTCFVTLDMPFPFNTADMKLWGVPVIGFQPLILAASVIADNNVIYWNPMSDTAFWLKERLFKMITQLKQGDRVLAHLTLKGNFIWDQTNPENPALYLDGEAFGFRRPDVTNTDLRLPSGNGRRGGDFEMWFWLTPPPDMPIPIHVTAVTFTKVRITTEETTMGTITLDAPAPAEGIVVSLDSSNTALRIPAEVRIDPGSTTATFAVQPNKKLVTGSTSALITATLGEVEKTVKLSVVPSANPG